MKRFFTLMSIMLFATSIAMGQKVISEEPKDASLKEYKNIHVGWIGLDDKLQKEKGYTSVENYEKEFAEVNKGFSDYIKKYVKGKELSYSGSKADKAVKGSDLEISFTINKLKSGYGSKMETTLTFTDLKTKKVVYTVQLKTKSGVMGIKVYTFLGRMDKMVKPIAKFIGKKLKQ